VAKRILYKNHATPQEQVSSGGRYYLDSDSGKKFSASHMLDLGSDTTATATVTSTTDLSSGHDFVAITATTITSGAVTISLDGTTEIIKLLEGECFASKIDSSATPKIHISGTATVEYMTAT
jgi:hypothetical protein